MLLVNPLWQNNYKPAWYLTSRTDCLRIYSPKNSTFGIEIEQQTSAGYLLCGPDTRRTYTLIYRRISNDTWHKNVQTPKTQIWTVTKKHGEQLVSSSSKSQYIFNENGDFMEVSAAHVKCKFSLRFWQNEQYFVELLRSCSSVSKTL